MVFIWNDSQVTRQITLVYCLSSCAVLSLMALLTFASDALLIAGSTRALPLFIPLVLFELIKWAVHHIMYDRDLKTKKSHRFGNLSVIYRHIDVVESVKGIIIFCLGTIFFYVVAVLFGAEILSKHEETLMFGAFTSLLTIFPMTLHTGRQAVMKFMANQPALNMFHKLFYRTFQFTLVGAWVGAAFIPLDWERPWQAWPITCSFGALIGNIMGYLFVLVQHFVFGAHGVFGKKKKLKQYNS
ncbi:GPI biosynthesis protein family Pig-F [Nesidiocoris tenuis]|uniref:GPI biosynthesis protein family Pig-F n=1 Tax=Nesidiocoris tenuis TaxID=355587 RepID=A0ABN7A7J5_9HEMI|nr:GPI biosynthesis protein family Pig-F [Nesidiocoris tenuis]